MIQLRQVEDYLYCPLLYYLKHECLEPLSLAERTTLELPRLAVQQALQAHASGKYAVYDLPTLVHNVWLAWFRQHKLGEDHVLALRGYQQARSEILDQFLSGHIRKRGNLRYQEPRASHRYKTMVRTAGLDALSLRIDESALPAMGIVRGELDQLNLGAYSLAEAYCDSLRMASSFAPFPAQAVLGVDVPAQADIGNGEFLRTTADLIINDGQACIVYVHDFSPLYVIDRTWIARRLPVLAAAVLHPLPGGPHFPPVEEVVYRHYLSGSEVHRKQLRASRLLWAVFMAKRGIQAAHYPPAFLSGDLSRCRRCVAQTVCLGADDVLEAVFPGGGQVARRARQARVDRSGGQHD